MVELQPRSNRLDLGNDPLIRIQDQFVHFSSSAIIALT